MSVATATLGITGLGLASGTAFAEDSKPSFNADRFGELMNEPLDTFAAQQKQHDPDDKTPDADGIRWDRDGCSAPDSADSLGTAVGQPLKGTPADDACNRHDAGYRTLQENHKWNPNSHKDADRRFEDDLLGLYQAGKISGLQVEALYGGVAIGSRLPSKVGDTEINGLPAYDESTDSPYQQPAPDSSRAKRSLEDATPPEETESASPEGAGGPDPGSQEARDASARAEQDLWGDDTSQGTDEEPESAGMSDASIEGGSFEQPGEGTFDQAQVVTLPASDDGYCPWRDGGASQGWGDGFTER